MIGFGIVVIALIMSLLLFIEGYFKQKKRVKALERRLEFKQEELNRVRDSLVQEEIKCNNFSARDGKARRIVGAYIRKHHELMRKIELLQQEVNEADNHSTILNIELATMKAKLGKLKKIPSKKRKAELKKKYNSRKKVK